MDQPRDSSAETPPPAPPVVGMTLTGVLDGMRSIASIAMFVIPFGVAFGVAAVQTGLPPWIATLMSALMCAGSSQFAALDLWRDPLPVLLLVVTVFAVNSRHLLYGAALYPRVSHLPPAQQLPILAVMTDMSWAHAMQRGRQPDDAGFLLGSGLMLYLVWVAATHAGALFGNAIGNPRTWGLDVVMVTYFGTTLATLWKGKASVRPWIAAAAGTLLGLWLLPPGWHIMAAAVAGGVAGVFSDDA